MSTSITVTFTASAGGITLDGGRSFGNPAELVKGDFRGREPVAWAAAQEFLRNGTTAGQVTITAS